MISYKPIIQNILLDSNYHLDVLRLDLLHEEIPGNKWFKLKHNLIFAKSEGKSTILTFGGAYSNHIAACAAACRIEGIRSIGVIRGEKHTILNSTLKTAVKNGMTLHFVSRDQYARKTDPEFIGQLESHYGPFLLIPEGGFNARGLLGCTEIVDPKWNYDYVVCASGTGCTFAGIAHSLNATTLTIGINVLRGNNSVRDDVLKGLSENYPGSHEVAGNDALVDSYIKRTCITDNYSFNGYAGYNANVVTFKGEFEREHNFSLDYIYTNKLFFAVFDLMRNSKLKPGSRVLVVHSGGQQSNDSFEKRYHLKPTR